jgi:hypothetical protein
VGAILLCAAFLQTSCTQNVQSNTDPATPINNIQSASRSLEVVGSTCDGGRQDITKELNALNPIFLEFNDFAFGETGAPYNNVIFYRLQVGELKIAFSYRDPNTTRNCLLVIRAATSNTFEYRAGFPTERSIEFISAAIEESIELSQQQCNLLTPADRLEAFPGGGLRRLSNGSMESTGLDVIASCDKLVKNNISSVVFSFDWGEALITLVSDQIIIERL